jgi:hypothetical protein
LQYSRLLNSCMNKNKQRFGNTSAKKLDIPVGRDHPDYMKYYRELRKDSVKAKQKEWADSNRDKENARWRKWYSQNRKERYLQTQFEKAEKLKRMPSWADKDAIAEFYRNCPDGHHVDHIVPLRGKNVSGLHILENLQYLPARDNMSKGNRFDS